MRKSILLLFAAFATLVASAHDFEVDGIYYNITSEEAKTAEVTYKGDSYNSYYNEYSGSITIPATVTHNGVEYSVTSIGIWAFHSCSSLTDITIPEGVKSIGSYAFEDCRSLTAITLPEGVTSIERGAFSDCSSLTDITIPASVTSIGYAAFGGCSSLTAIIVEEGNEVYDSRNGCNAIIETNSNTLIQGCSTTIIPEGVTSIGIWAFHSCSSLTDITIPEGVKSIGECAFIGCSSLTAINIPESVTSIGSYAFSLCSSLTSITIPEGVTSIEDGAFYDCSSLTSITIPEGVTSIGVGAFSDCSSLTAINIPEGVTSIEGNAFEYCRSLTDIVVAEGNQTYDSRGGCNAIIETASNTLISGCSTTIIPESVTSIGDYAFYGCTSLTAITIPEGVMSIGEWAFAYCYGLTAITLPKSVDYIYSNAFAYCPELLDVYCYAESVPSTEADAFDVRYIEYATLHVPTSAINNYKTTAPWSSFGTIKTIENVTLEKCATPTINYKDGKVVFACDTDGAIVKSNFIENIAGSYNDMEVAFIPTYTLTAYATKENYEDSDEVTLTICWVPCGENHESEETGILTIPSKPVLISARDGVLTLSGLADGTEVTLYTTDGTMVAHQQSSAGEAKFTVDTNQVYLVHIGDKVVKIGM